MDSILTSIKKLLGITEDYDYFDPDIIMHINTALSTLTQLGVGPSEGFMIGDKTATWSDFISDKKEVISVKTYVYLKVKKVFDPPLSSIVMEAMNENIKELEWRLNVSVDPGNVNNVGGGFSGH